MAATGGSGRRLVIKAKNKEELMKQLEQLVTDKGKKSLMGHIERLVCDKGKVVQCQLPANIDKGPTPTSNTLDTSTIVKDEPETPPLISIRDENGSVQQVGDPVQDDQNPEEKEVPSKFTYDPYLTAADKVTFEEFMAAAQEFGANAEGASAQHLRDYFSHLSFISRMAATQRYDPQVHVDYDKAIRGQAEEIGWAAFKADNTTVTITDLYYKAESKTPINKKATDRSGSEQCTLEDTLDHQSNAHDMVDVTLKSDDHQSNVGEGTILVDDHQSKDHIMCATSETLVPQFVQEHNYAKNTRKTVVVKKKADINAPPDTIWQSFTTVCGDPSLLQHSTESQSLSHCTPGGNSRQPPQMEITIVQPSIESDSSINQEQEGKKRVRSKTKSRKASTPAVLNDGSPSVFTEKRICSYCGKQFPRPSQLKRHLKTHTKDPMLTQGGPPTKPHLCEECGKRFQILSQLKIHMRKHTGEKPYSCIQCGKNFMSSAVLSQHMKMHAEKQYICSYCGKQFRQRSALTIHTRIHTAEKPYVCSYCGKGFTGSGYLRSHMRVHTGEKPYKCSDCGQQFTISGNLIRHKLIHTGEKPYKCPYCSTECRQRGSLQEHIRLWHTQDATMCSCPHCSYKSKHRSNMSKHIKLCQSGGTHNGETSTRRRATADGATERSHSCSDCGRMFKWLSSLKVHMITHTGGDPLTCPECGKRFRSLPNLRVHIMKHIQEKPFECSECGKGFAAAANLEIHAVTHTGEKPHVCSDCGKTFSLKGNLHRHKKIHMGEKNFVCSYCGKAFTQKVILQLHIMIHTGEKPFVCAECGKGFSRAADLRKHMKVHRKATITEEPTGINAIDSLADFETPLPE